MPSRSVDPNLTIIAAKVPLELKAKLMELASIHTRNMSQEIRRILTEAVAAEFDR